MKRMMPVCLLCAAVASVTLPAVVCRAQEPNQPAAAPVPGDEAEAEKMIKGIRNLVLPQQKRLARDLIRKYPDTHLAKLAQRLLDEYVRYDELRDAELREESNRRAQVRAYWDARRLPPRAADGRPVTITNTTDEPVLYQYKGPALSWSRPVALREGGTHTYHYAVQLRQVTPSRLVRHSLSPGGRYVFKMSGVEPRLYATRP